MLPLRSCRTCFRLSSHANIVVGQENTSTAAGFSAARVAARAGKKEKTGRRRHPVSVVGIYNVISSRPAFGPSLS